MYTNDLKNKNTFRRLESVHKSMEKECGIWSSFIFNLNVNNYDIFHSYTNNMQLTHWPLGDTEIIYQYMFRNESANWYIEHLWK